jgi:glycosyltransferase involved in cell wall biosynthesis
MRVAWLGPEPTHGGGVPYVGLQILSALPGAGVEVDAYIAGTEGDLSDLAGIDGLALIRESTYWHWDRWYSRTPLTSVVSGQVARLAAQRRLIGRLVDANRRTPYDVIYQFSQFESPWSLRTARTLPPVVVHPEVHAAGELRWHRRESALSRRCEPSAKRVAVRGILIARTTWQRRASSAVQAIVAPSATFARDLIRDYSVPASRVHVVPNPVDLHRFSPPSPRTPAATPAQLVYVSRLAVRKGVELVVALSHRLSDLAGEVRLRVVGDRSTFSNYRPLLTDLHPAVATYEGSLSARKLAELYRQADALLQPSRYEPFALTVGEALASGLPVVVSDQVGAREGVDRRVCRVFADGDLDGFEASVRDLLRDLDARGRDGFSHIARGEAERLFAAGVVTQRLAEVFRHVSA